MKTQHTSRNGRIERHVNHAAMATGQERPVRNSMPFCTAAACLLVVGWFMTAPVLGRTCISAKPGYWWSTEVWERDDVWPDIPGIPGPDDDVIVKHALVMDAVPVYVRSLTVAEQGQISCMGCDLQIWATRGIDIVGGYVESRADPNTPAGGALTLVSGQSISIQTSGDSFAIHAGYDITLEGREGIDLSGVWGTCMFSQDGAIVLRVPAKEDIRLAEGMQLAQIAQPEPTVLEVWVIDDFEDYATSFEGDERKWIWETWTDGYDDPNNGSVVGNEGYFAELGVVHSGRQSMPLYYDETEGATESVTYRTFDPNTDWSRYAVLSLWIHGDPNNIVTEEDRFFVRIEDTDGNSVTFMPSEPNALLAPGWTPCLVILDGLHSQGLDVDHIAGMGMGVRGATVPGSKGRILLDEIRLLDAASLMHLLLSLELTDLGNGIWQIELPDGSVIRLIELGNDGVLIELPCGTAGLFQPAGGQANPGPNPRVFAVKLVDLGNGKHLVQANGTWYFIEPGTKPVKVEVIDLGNGELLIKVGDTWYHFDPMRDPKLVPVQVIHLGEGMLLIKVGDMWYHFDPARDPKLVQVKKVTDLGYGALKVELPDGTVFLVPIDLGDGKILINVDGTWYFLGPDTEMVEAEVIDLRDGTLLIKVGDTWYHFDPARKPKLVKAGVINLGNGRQLFVVPCDTRYLFENGRNPTGYLFEDGKLKAKGHLQAGRTKNGDWEVLCRAIRFFYHEWTESDTSGEDKDITLTPDEITPLDENGNAVDLKDPKHPPVKKAKVRCGNVVITVEFEEEDGFLVGKITSIAVEERK